MRQFNSLAPGKLEWNFWSFIFQIISVIDGWGISCELALRWMSLDLTDEVNIGQVMDRCRQATSHYLSECWPRSLLPYVITRPQWVNVFFLCRLIVLEIFHTHSTHILLGCRTAPRHLKNRCNFVDVYSNTLYGRHHVRETMWNHMTGY